MKKYLMSTCSMKPLTSILFYRDLGIVMLSIVLAIVLVRTEALIPLFTQTREIEFLGSFIAGLFFTSVFTTAPSIVALSELAQAQSLLWVGIFGALGAVVGDVLIFRFVRDQLSAHIVGVMKNGSLKKKLKALATRPILRYASLFVAGLIIASPFPDELGISLLGFSKVKLSWFVPLAFVFNFVGIVLIGLVARAV